MYTLEMLRDELTPSQQKEFDEALAAWRVGWIPEVSPTEEADHNAASDSAGARLSRAFDWAGSPQGIAYWSRVHDQLIRAPAILRAGRPSELAIKQQDPTPALLQLWEQIIALAESKGFECRRMRFGEIVTIREK